MTLRIHMWSSPRNLSTAMMYAWRERADTTVVDEPLYAHYLRVSGREHPGRADVLAAQSDDADTVIRDVLEAPYPTDVVFFKQMAKHLQAVDRRFMADARHVLLTREPRDMLTSLQVQLPDATVADTGFEDLLSILHTLQQRGEVPVVIDSKQLLLDPAGVLGQACARLGLAFDPSMLRWPAGRKPEDGVWAPHWYAGVHRSTGWQPWSPKSAALRPGLEPVLQAVEPMYGELMTHSIRARSDAAEAARP